MKRLTKYLLGAAAAFLVGLAVSVAAWLATTTEGTRWFLTSVSPLIGIRISAHKIEGRLSDRLHLTGVRIGLMQQQLELDSIELDWQPRLLLSGIVAIQELTLRGVRIQDNAPAQKTTDLSWPRVSGIASHLTGKIVRLRLAGLSYRHLAEQPVLVNTLMAGVTWHDNLLSVDDLSAATPIGSITGNIRAGFNQPSLTADLAVIPAHPVAEIDLFTLKVRRLPGKSAEPFAGEITIVGRSGAIKILELTGEVAMARNAFNLRRLSLTRPGRRGLVTAEGTLGFATRESLLTLQVKAADLDLAPELDVPTNLSGILTFKGTLADYNGTFALVNTGKGWQSAKVSGAYRGTGAGLKLAPVTGSILDGTLGGNLDVDWRTGLTLRGALHARKLNPTRLAPDWQGVANFNAAGSVAWSGNAPVRGELNGALLESSLHGQALTGEVRTHFTGANLVIDRLALQGKGFDINASGELNERLSLAANIIDFSRLVPETAGSLKVDGWMRRRTGQFSGNVTGQGKNLVVGGTRIAAAELTARLEEGTDRPLQVAATLQQVVYDRFKAETVTITADGTAQQHSVRATLRSAGAGARLDLSGGYGAGTWRGEIARLEGRDGTGSWSLAAPTAFAVSAGKIALSPLVIKGVGPERIEVAVELARQPLSGPARAQWAGLNLARINPYLRDEQLKGVSNGTIRLDLRSGQRLALSGSVAASGTVTTRGHSVTVQRSLVTFAGDEQGIQGSIALSTASGGRLKGKFSSPAPLRPVMPDQGNLTAELTGIDLALFQPWLPRDIRLAGILSGQAKGTLLQGQRFELAGSATASGTVTARGRSVNVQQSLITFAGDEQGMTGGIELSTSQGGRLTGTFSSPAPLRLVIPDRGKMTAELAGIDMALFQPWLPSDIKLAGRLSGRAKGMLLAGQRLELDGTVALSGGKAHWARPDGEIDLNLRTADVSWGWREESLRGTVAVTMAEYGQIRGSFQLPIPARLAVAVRPQGQLLATLTGQVREKGIITTLFPGLIQESYGELDADLKAGGTWETPRLEGTMHLAKAGAYLPTAGIRVKDVELTARMEKNLIRIDSFRAVSGPGHIEGTALLTMAGRQVTGYRGSITGERFQTIFFPELQIQSTPKLTFEGTSEKLTVRGELRLPELRIIGAQSRTVVVPSGDVIVEGRASPALAGKTALPVLDVQVRVVLGDQVFVKVAGIDAQLGGAIDLSLLNLDRITSKGEIKVSKGRYRTYGVNLEIVRGRLFYAGGPIDRPTLDILALRTIGDVRAGVTVGGTLRNPVTKLYSEPTMPDIDVLAYVVLGHPLGSSSAQGSLVAQAAGVLLSTSQSQTLQEQLKTRLGLSTLEIQGGVGGTTSHMGYKPLPVTPPGAIPSTQQPGITETMMTVGKFLTPKLYISYGRSLFTGTNLFLLRYDLSKRWEVESQTGSESGVDLYYKLEFN